MCIAYVLPIVKFGCGDKAIVTHSRALAWSLITMPLEVGLPVGSLSWGWKCSSVHPPQLYSMGDIRSVVPGVVLAMGVRFLYSSDGLLVEVDVDVESGGGLDSVHC